MIQLNYFQKESLGLQFSMIQLNYFRHFWEGNFHNHTMLLFAESTLVQLCSLQYTGQSHKQMILQKTINLKKKTI